MDLELPFEETDSSLDPHLAAIDRELDALFLDAVEGEMERLRLQRLEIVEDGKVA